MKTRKFKKNINDYCCENTQNIIKDYVFDLETTEKPTENYSKVITEINNIDYELKYMEKCKMWRSRIYYMEKIVEYY